MEPYVKDLQSQNGSLAPLSNNMVGLLLWIETKERAGKKKRD